MKPPTPIKYAMMASALLASASTSYGIMLDGIYGDADVYTGSETVQWFNGHSPNTAFGNPANQTTTIRYQFDRLDGDDAGPMFFFLYVEAPLYAKNMIWQNGLADADPMVNTNPALGLTEDDVSPYRKQFSHHTGDILNLDFGTATGSEKLVFGTPETGKHGELKFKADFTANLYGSADIKFDLIGYNDSASYLIDNGISTEALSLARGTPMSFEFQFAVDQSTGISEGMQLVDLAMEHGLEIHMSPERGLLPDDPGTNVPEPRTSLLGVLGLMIILRRRNR